MYENWKILKSEADEKAEEYSQVAKWCNESGKYHIEEQGEYYVVVKNAEPSAEDIKKARISDLKQQLAETDYVIIKIAEGSATTEEYASVIANRKEWRAEIQRLEDD